ncbi:MAG: hypothetical protein AAB975_00710 [Patescibacteria group bacterium]
MKRFLAILSVTIIPLLLGIIPLVTSAKLISFDNPITSGNVMGLIQSVINQLFPIAITILSVVIIYCAARYVIGVGFGSDAEATKWKKALYSLIPLTIIIVGAKTFIEAVRIFGESLSGP